MTLIVASVILESSPNAFLNNISFQLFYVEVFLVGFLVNSNIILIFIQQVKTAELFKTNAELTNDQTLEPSPMLPTPAIPIFKERLPSRCRTLLVLKSQDHYVRAYSPKRGPLILIGLRDAIAELGDAAGLRVHGSWWISRNAVKDQIRCASAWSLALGNGIGVPVSREG